MVRCQQPCRCAASVPGRTRATQNDGSRAAGGVTTRPPTAPDAVRSGLRALFHPSCRSQSAFCCCRWLAAACSLVSAAARGSNVFGATMTSKTALDGDEKDAVDVRDEKVRLVSSAGACSRCWHGVRVGLCTWLCGSDTSERHRQARAAAALRASMQRVARAPGAPAAQCVREALHADAALPLGANGAPRRSISPCSATSRN